MFLLEVDLDAEASKVKASGYSIDQAAVALVGQQVPVCPLKMSWYCMTRSDVDFLH